MDITKQTKANRRNAQKSTGPRTDDGKKASRMNALKHGLSAKQIVIPGENPEEFRILHQRLMDDYAPQTTLEEQLIDLIAGDIWRLKRIAIFEPTILAAYLSFIDQLDAEIRCKLARGRADERVANVIQLYKDEGAAGAFTEGERNLLDAYLAQLDAVEACSSPMTKLGRALVRQGKGLDALGRLSRYECALSRNLERHMDMLDKEQAKRISRIEVAYQELES